MKIKNCGNESSMVILYDKNLGDTIIAGNTYIRSNIMIKSRDLFMYSLQIGINTGETKYRI